MASPPPLPASFNRPDLEASGFAGWHSWGELRNAGYPVPAKPLCYVIYRVADTAPAFLDASLGGRFKGKDPTVADAALASKWVVGATPSTSARQTSGTGG